MMERIYLLSYPRSGNTFTRYILENLTKYRSRGYKNSSWDEFPIDSSIDFTNRGEIIKRHGHLNLIGPELKKEEKSNSQAKLILLVRNPLESFIRHAGINSVYDFCNKNIKEFDYFFKNIRIFNETRLEKKVIYYEDMISNPALYIEELSSFLKNPAITAKDFMKNYEFHFNKCRNHYGNSKSSGRDAIVYSSKLQDFEKTKFWKKFKKLIPEESENLFERFMK